MMQLYAKTGHVTCRKMESGKVVVLDMESGKYYVLSETASLAWDLLMAPVSIEQVAMHIAEGFSVSVERAQSDLDALIGTLVDADLIEKSEAAPVEAPIRMGDAEYVAPQVEEHQAVQEVTAGTHYWY